MSQKTEIVTAIGTLGCAICIGFIMQNDEIADLRYGSSASAEAATVPLVGIPASSSFTYDAIPIQNPEPLDVRAITLTSAAPDSAPDSAQDAGTIPAVFETSAEIEADYQVETPVETPVAETPATADIPECSIEITAVSSAAAMIDFRLEAPCQGASVVSITQNGLTFDERLSDDGRLDLMIPAFSEMARVSALFPTGETAEATLDMASVPFYDRVAVQSRTDAGVQIHAREAGASYGTTGHVWSGAARDISAIAEGRGGFLTRLGDATVQGAKQLEVYTYPTALGTAHGDVALSIETEVTQANCGQEIRAQAQQFSAGNQVSSQDLSLFVPDCDAVGSFLVLNNLLQDLTVASK